MTTRASDAQPTAWDDALLAADLLALDACALGGAQLHGAAGPARDAWLARVRAGLGATAPMLRVPCHATAEALLGGLDLAATLATGHRKQQHGILARADGGVALLAMAERWSPASAALVTAVMDRRETVLERDGFAARTPTRFGIIAFDESCGDEPGPAEVLTDRLAFRIDLDGIGMGEVMETSAPLLDAGPMRAALLDMPPADGDLIKALCRAALELGVVSLRMPILALAVARAHAARAGRSSVTIQDVAVAARLVLAPRATRIPAAAEASQDPAEPPPDTTDTGDTGDGTTSSDDAAAETMPDDIVLAAARAAIPAGLLEMIARGQQRVSRTRADGRAGAVRKSVHRGRVTGVQPATSATSARLDILATLRAAVPWQRLRGQVRIQGLGVRIQIRREDFRVKRYKHRSGTTIVFTVDASGSAALHRLTEAKGAVELLLAECYARRDSVALVAFRGTGADVRLPPSRSLTRAKRSLASLPGGGGTPLAAGLDAAAEVAAGARRKGDTPLVVVLTDGRANVSRDGKGGRPEAEKQALQAARQMQSQGFAAVLLDTSPLPHPFAKRLAAEMGGRYVPLPVAGAEAISTAVQRELQSSQS